MSLKEDWKETGSSIGNAIKDIGKATVKTVKVGVDRLDDWAEGRAKEDSIVPEKNVTNDGTWTEAGKELSDAIAGLGKTVVKSAKEGVHKISDTVDKIGEENISTDCEDKTDVEHQIDDEL